MVLKSHFFAGVGYDPSNLPVEGKPGGLEGDLEQALHCMVGELVDVKYPACRACADVQDDNNK